MTNINLEDLHWKLQAEVNRIEERSWGRRITRDDMKFIIELKKRLQEYSNRLYSAARDGESVHNVDNSYEEHYNPQSFQTDPAG